ncbi:NmrA family NAD(P)-binding protein [Bradyrhizobium sp. CCBAU 21360]|uniref:NmrA family NAD(P)-binding protein n=1 Tax=Bradyrhizobium sp. CCBAU 21360 TaxID=1325081 RepID=UPI002305B66C|nr:NAD(P)H-binding protein [Bradyrhizobium sp. CCBAU 21360]MDA9451194.1 hypothetical protein [Bradyrhizobium sp. CCBAU 21360]
MEEITLVVGASGFVGSEVVRLLRAGGHRAWSVTSKPASSPDTVTADVVQGKGLDEAFRKATKAFLMAPPGHSDQHALLSPQIEAARANGLKKVVMLSAPGAGDKGETPFREAEIELEQSGLAYSILRPNWFMQNFNSYWLNDIRNERKIYLPVGAARASFIDTRDIGAAAAALLTTKIERSGIVDLTGPVAMTHAEIAEEISIASGKPVRFVDISPAAFESRLLGFGVPEAAVDYLSRILAQLKEGHRSPVTFAFEEIVERKPRYFAEYAQDHRKHWT